MLPLLYVVFFVATPFLISRVVTLILLMLPPLVVPVFAVMMLLLFPVVILPQIFPALSLILLLTLCSII